MGHEHWKRRFLWIGIRHISAPDEKSRETVAKRIYWE